jgi:hypothetical protein
MVTDACKKYEYNSFVQLVTKACKKYEYNSFVQLVTNACKKYGGFYLGSIGGPAAILAEKCIKKVGDPACMVGCVFAGVLVDSEVIYGI